MSRVRFEDIQVDRELYDLVNNEIAPGTGVSPDTFWSTTAALLRTYAPRNERLLRKRDRIQAQIDEYHMRLRDEKLSLDPLDYASFLSSIGYIVPRGGAFTVATSNVDDEIARIPGAQLVVPVDNARYALNAANARWGSLLDAFYGTDAGPAETDGAEKGRGYNPVRGKKVFEYAHKFLDDFFPLTSGASYNDVTKFEVSGSQLNLQTRRGGSVSLQEGEQFVGFNRGSNGGLTSVLLRHNGLHVEVQIDASSNIGRTHAAGVKDILIESAVTAIADLEDSVAAVDAQDKVGIYRNWTGLMKGDLLTSFKKGGKEITRSLNSDKTFITPCGKSNISVSGRACLLVRQVGLHMYNDAILTERGEQTPEGLMDLMVTTLAALHDLNKADGAKIRNSRLGSMYIVKPKMHGPEEAEFVLETFAFVEKAFNLQANTLKIGIMDEERRTTVNLLECIRAARNRCIFINTGFMDRTGDEIHTSFYAGPVQVKGDIKKALWRTAYEAYNVEVGLKVGLLGRGQIGKGMWAAPNAMKNMLATKMNHPQAGATCAWVPSPTAATLHAIHYHQVDVLAVQRGILKKVSDASVTNLLRDILVPPIMTSLDQYDERTIMREVENSAQGILGYVVRWVQFGVGCSTVPDMNDVGLMEDRATLRISSQHIANWLYHGVVSQEQVVRVFERMSKVVDRQNLDGGKSQGYVAMYNNFMNSNAFQCALELVMNGKYSENGLTEDILTKYRKKEKAQGLKARL